MIMRDAPLCRPIAIWGANVMHTEIVPTYYVVLRPNTQQRAHIIIIIIIYLLKRNHTREKNNVLLVRVSVEN